MFEARIHGVRVSTPPRSQERTIRELEIQLRHRFLDRLDDPSWNDEDPRLDFGSEGLPYFIDAFDPETDVERRRRLIRIIWQFRDPKALAVLNKALQDLNEEIWKEAIDGLVCLGGRAALEILTSACTTTESAYQREWLDEARLQVAEHLLGYCQLPIDAGV